MVSVCLVSLALVGGLLWYYYNKYFRNMQPSLGTYCRLLLWFRGKNLEKFMDEHEKLFREAKKTGDHFEVTSHWYDMMADLIHAFYGDNFHFATPSYEGQSNDLAMKDLHSTLARLLGLAPGVHALDIGSGVGGLSRDMARASGAFVTGIASSQEEADLANRLHKELGLGFLCNQVRGDMQKMDFKDASYDAVAAVYTLKHLTHLEPVMGEVSRVLKPNGKMLVLCMQKSEKYDPDNAEHRAIFEGFEYSCGMPTMHSVAMTVDIAKQNHLELVTRMNLSHGNLQWHSVFTNNKPLLWALSSPLVFGILGFLDGTLLPKGFRRFMKTFVCNNVLSISRAGTSGIMTGAEVLIFEKKN